MNVLSPAAARLTPSPLRRSRSVPMSNPIPKATKKLTNQGSIEIAVLRSRGARVALAPDPGYAAMGQMTSVLISAGGVVGGLK